MKIIANFALALILCTGSLAQSQAGAEAVKTRKSFTIGTALSTGTCVAGIAGSRNPAGAATVGLPVLFVGNITGYLLNRKGHKKAAAVAQGVSGLFCLGFGLTRSGRNTVPVASKTPVPSPGDPAPPTTPPGDPGTGTTPPPPSGCQQDCGLPGNGGVNDGNDGKKPPFPGNPHRPGA